MAYYSILPALRDVVSHPHEQTHYICKYVSRIFMICPDWFSTRMWPCLPISNCLSCPRPSRNYQWVHRYPPWYCSCWCDCFEHLGNLETLKRGEWSFACWSANPAGYAHFIHWYLMYYWTQRRSGQIWVTLVSPCLLFVWMLFRFVLEITLTSTAFFKILSSLNYITCIDCRLYSRSWE